MSSFFHGPGESPHSSGEGSGVTSPMADIRGLGKAELAAEAGPKPWLRPRPVLKLGVRETGRRDEADVLCVREVAERPTPPLRLSDRGGGAGGWGGTSVCNRRLSRAPSGLGW